MFLTTRTRIVPHFSPSRSSSSPISIIKSKSEADYLLFETFHESVHCRLKALNPPAITLSWLSTVADFLSFLHSELKRLFPQLQLDALDNSSLLSSYLDDTASILDLCNFVTSEIEGIRNRRLSIDFAIQLLLTSSDCGSRVERLRRAKDLLAGWESKGLMEIKRRSFGKIKVLALPITPPGKISGKGKLISHTMYGVRLLTVFFAGVFVAAVNGSTHDLYCIRVPNEFCWAEAMNSLESAISAELTRPSAYFKELDDVRRQVRKVNDAVNDMITIEKDGDKCKENRFNGNVKELKRVTELLTMGLDRLTNDVDKAFHSVLSNRNEVFVGESRK